MNFNDDCEHQTAFSLAYDYAIQMLMADALFREREDSLAIAYEYALECWTDWIQDAEALKINRHLYIWRVKTPGAHIDNI